jgi:hypothetical protein
MKCVPKPETWKFVRDLPRAPEGRAISVRCVGVFTEAETETVRVLILVCERERTIVAKCEGRNREGLGNRERPRIVRRTEQLDVGSALSLKKAVGAILNDAACFKDQDAVHPRKAQEAMG